MGENTNGHEKSPLQSKKFVAFLIAYIVLMAWASLVLVWAWNLDEVSTRVFLLLLATVLIAGFLATGYILGQAGLDRYVRLAQIAADGAVKGLSQGKLLEKGTKGLIKVDEPVVGEEKPAPDEKPVEEEPEPDPKPEEDPEIDEKP